MVLESTMVCVDDSDYMRNGDFVPTRMAAMQDAVQVVCNAKTRQNPENNVGLLTLASSEVLSTLTTDPNKLISKLLAVQPEGELKLLSGLRVAHLALKHRQGKNHKMRIIVFIGSPIEGLDANELVRLAKKFKKEKVNVDIVTFGDGDQELLQKFIDTLNGEDGSNSRLVVVPPGPNLTSALMGSPILMTEDGIHMAGAGGGNFDFGIDPNDDPELALALRVSMEEQRARQDAESRSAAAESGAEAGATHEEQMLEQALAMSMAPGSSGASASGPSRPSAPVPSVDLSAMTEEQQIAYALQMSMQDTSYAQAEASKAVDVKMEIEDQAVSSSEAAGTAGSTDSGDVEMADVEQATVVVKTEPESSEVQDTAFLEQLLEDLPGQSAVKEEPADKKDAASKTSTTSPTSKGSKTSAGSSKKPAGGGTSDKKKPDPKKNGASSASSSARSTTSTNAKRGAAPAPADKKKPSEKEPPKKKK